MRKRWVGYLLALFALLWARLPGPQTQKESKPSSKIHVSRKGEIVEISTKAAELPLLSDHITGITVQEVKPLASGRYIADGELLRSKVEVKIAKPNIAELRVLNNPDMEDMLLRGSGQIAIVTGVVKEGKLEVEKEFLGKGIRRGEWEIQTWKK